MGEINCDGPSFLFQRFQKTAALIAKRGDVISTKGLMSEHDLLWAAVLAHPEDDVARLVYADWLEEHGQPTRASFIRHQILAAQAEADSPTARYHTAHADRLLLEHRTEWSQSVRSRVLACDFHRGFIDQVRVDVATFPTDAPALFAAEPIRSLQPDRWATNALGDSLQPFFASPYLENATRLDFSQIQVAPVELEPLADCEHLRKITGLVLCGTPLLPELLERLLTGPAMPALASLDLSDLSHLGPRLARVLPTLRHRRFRHLNISRIVLNSQQLQQILASPCLSEVEELRLGWMTGANRDGPLTHLDLGWVIPWKRLRRLDLDNQGLGDNGLREMVREWARRAEPSPLRRLGLAHNRLTAEGLQMLAQVPESRLQLYYLDVRGNHWNDASIRQLQQRFPEAWIVT